MIFTATLRCSRFTIARLATAAKASSFGLVSHADVVAALASSFLTTVRVSVTAFWPLFAVVALLDVPDISPRVVVLVPLFDEDAVVCSRSNRTLRACFGTGGVERGGVADLDIADVILNGRCEPPRCGDVACWGDDDSDDSFRVLFGRRPLGGGGDPRPDGVDAPDACGISSSLSTNSSDLYREL